MANCSECGIELAKLQVQIDEVIREVFTHPPNRLKHCSYQADGIKVTTEVVDLYLMEKFQEYAQTCKSQVNSKETTLNEPLMLPLKKRLSKGELSIPDFKQIRDLLKED